MLHNTGYARYMRDHDIPSAGWNEPTSDDDRDEEEIDEIDDAGEIDDAEMPEMDE